MAAAVRGEDGFFEGFGQGGMRVRAAEVALTRAEKVVSMPVGHHQFWGLMKIVFRSCSVFFALAALVGPLALGGASFSDANWVSMDYPGVGIGDNPAVGGTVHAVTVDGSGNVCVGGVFSRAGGAPANNIAKWNGSSWSALGAGMDGPVYALAMFGGDLYAGGNFTTAGGSPANYIAKWDGSNWTAVGSGMDSAVLALTVSGSDLYAGGAFTAAGENPANRIAKWDGSRWSTLGSGMNSNVHAVAV